MNFLTQQGRALPLAAVLAVGAGFAFGAYAQAGADTALVPFVVNVDANVKAELKEGAAVASRAEMNVTANEEAVLRLPLKTTTGALNVAQRRGNVPAVVSRRGGKVAVNLSAESYKSAEVSLYTVNGKRILRKNASASNAANNIPRRNTAAGSYLLSVRGAGGGAVTSRITHGGGDLDICVTFGGGNTPPAPRSSAKKADGGGWSITVSAYGYVDSAYTLHPAEGMNTLQDITLRIASVVIGGKRWMSKNLNIATADSWCYGNSPDSCKKYGRLYTWEAALTACPAGWHLPTREEWGELAVAAGGDGDYGDRGGIAGKALKSTSGWRDNRNGTDDYGFSALPSGYRNSSGSFNAGSQSLWWTATTTGFDSNSAYMRNIDSNFDYMYENWSTKNNNAFSVRCIAD